MAKSTGKHQKALERLLYSSEELQRIGIEGKIWAAIEVPWWKDGDLYCEVDLLVFTGTLYELPFHVVEYKSSGGKRKKGLDQIDRYEEFVGEMFGEPCYKYLVTGRYNVEVVGQRPKKCQ